MVVEFLLTTLLAPAIIAGVLALERVEERLGRPGRDSAAPSEAGMNPALGPATSSHTD